jgi:hypothetical protein
MQAQPAGSGSAAPGEEAPGTDGDELDDMLKGAFDDKPAGSAAPPADSSGGPTGKNDEDPPKEDRPPPAADSAEQAPKQVTAKHVVAHRTVNPVTHAKPARAVARKN